MTAAETIEALGGDHAVAQWLGVTTQMVHHFRVQNAFPPKHYLALSAMAAEFDAPRPDESLFRSITREERQRGKTAAD